ncbi:hypothetical protein BJY00DRAFT_273905 [Aspergillus carlsbadensis]|nr:hypothetical protein BJY00DRAFT_273905 [Aspergillus carlsbadensis]
MESRSTENHRCSLFWEPIIGLKHASRGYMRRRYYSCLTYPARRLWWTWMSLAHVSVCIYCDWGTLQLIHS